MHPERKRLIKAIFISSVVTFVIIISIFVVSYFVIGLSFSAVTYICIASIAIPTDVMLWTVSLPLREWWMDANKTGKETAKVLEEIRDAFNVIMRDIHIMSLNMNDVRNAVMDQDKKIIVKGKEKGLEEAEKDIEGNKLKFPKNKPDG